MLCSAADATVFCFAWIGLFGASFALPDHGSAQLAPASRQDIVRIPIVEGRDIRFRKLSNSQHLSQVRVESIVQDTQGFMWFGTWNGLNRYDGYKFRLFKHEADDPNSLSGVSVYALFKDHSGNLWVGTEVFLDRFDPQSETFTHFRLDQLPANSLSKAVTHISEDSSGRLWLSTKNGLFSFDPDHRRMKRYFHDPADPFSLGDSEISSTGEDRAGNFWVATRYSLDEFDRETGKVTHHIQVSDSGIGLWFHEDRFGVFWVVYGSQGQLATLDRKTQRLTRYEYDWKTGPAQANQLYSMLEDSSGTMWFCTAAAGLMKFDRRNSRFVSYRHDPADADTISDNRVNTLFEDREEDIWIGLDQKEPDYFPLRPPSFENFSRLTRPIQNELSGQVTAIYEDGRDQVWLAANRRLYHINRKTAQIWPFKGVDNSEVFSIIPDGPDVLWFGNAYPGLLRYNMKTGERRGYRHNRDDSTTLCSGVIDELLIDRKGVLWSATWNGLCRFDSSNSLFTTYVPTPGNRGLNYYSIAQAPDGEWLWLGGTVGLHRFDPRTKTFTVYTHNPEDPTSISNDQVNAVFFDHAGTLWAGTQNGLDRFDPVSHRFKSYDQRNGMSGTVVSCILQDSRGMLWMSTNNGISSFDTKSEHFANYTVADGLSGPDLTGTGACYKSSRGEIFFAGLSGATAFFPDKVVESPYVPQPVLTDFRLFGSSVVPGRGSPLKTAINRASAIQLSHSENILSIEFSALSYLNPETNRYRYKLDGIDKGWREVGSDERLASYTTLPAGNHTFRLEAATSRGPWSPDLVLEIEILPPFWLTYWFLTCFIVALCGILGLLHRLRLNHLSAQFNMRVEERVGERTRIAQELHDTLVQNITGLSLQMSGLAKTVSGPEYVKERLQDLRRQADDCLREARQSVWDIRSPQSETIDLAAELTESGKQFVAGKATRFDFITDGNPRPLPGEVRQQLLRIGREAIGNAAQHARAAHIEALLIFKPHRICLRVTDDGCGFDLSQAERLPGHFGLSTMRERAARVQGSVKIRSSLGQGTSIEVSFPSEISKRDER
jgi:signal transduction histidine kinase/ligand-binding sensor domain-containing protein